MNHAVRRNFPLIVVAVIAIILFGIFFLTPLFYLLRTSFWKYAPNAVGARGFMVPAFTFENFQRALTGTYLDYIILTLRIGVISTVAAVLLSYPVAFWIARWSGHARLKRFLLITLIASFLVGSMARVFAWYSMLTGQGFVNSLLSILGFQTFRFIGTELAIEICQVQYLMSVATLSLVSPLKNVDPRFEEASKSLGAEEIRTFLNVTLPLSLPGIVAASLLCFAITVSAYVTPLVLGAGGILMVSNLVSAAFLEVSNYPLGAAFAVILLLTSFVSMYVLEKALLSRVRT
jgi:putative spermidine/putrescine transport system permease protein